MAQLKQQLEDAGFDTSGLNEADLLSQLDQAGFDTSSLVSDSTQPQTRFPIDPEVMNEPGLTDVSLSPVTKPDLEAEGVKIAESKFGQKNPKTAAAIGTVVSMPEEFIGAFTGIKGAKAAAEGIRGAGSLIKRMGKAIVTPKNSEEIAALRGTLAELPVKTGKKMQVLEGLRSEIGPELSKIEKAAGLGMKEVPQAPADVTQFANELKVFADYTPEQLAQQIPVERAQELKKIAQVVKRGNILPEERAFINQGVESLDKYIGKEVPELGEGLSRFRQIEDSLESLPLEAKAEKQRILSQIRRLKNEAEGATSEKVRKLVTKALGVVGKYGAIGLGMRGF